MGARPTPSTVAAGQLVVVPARHRHAVRQRTRQGVLAEVDSTPPGGVAPGTPSGGNTPDPAKFAAFMTKFVTKYGETVSAYEIWNEPNGVLSSNPINPAAYAALVKAAYQAIKPLDPTATVVAGAVGHVVTFGNVTMDPVDLAKAMIAADPTIGQYFDAPSYHPYDVSLPFSQGVIDPNSGWWASDTAFNQLKDLVKLFPTKKVWITEFGVPTYTYTDANGVVHTITQDQQEKYIADLINNWAASFGVNAGPIFLYTLQEFVTLFWTFQLPWHWAYSGNVAPATAQFAFGLYSLMLTSEIIA